MNTSLVREKLDQAVAILNEQDLDLWLTFVREPVARGAVAAGQARAAE